MNPDLELSEIMQSIAEKGMRLLNNIQEQPVDIHSIIEKFTDFTRDFQGLVSAIIKNPDKIWEVQVTYWQDALKLLKAQLQHWLDGRSMSIPDKRFNSEEWLNNPFFNLLSQQYLLASEHLNKLLKQLDYEDKQLAKRVHFLAKQYVDALSPDNFLYTNPQILAETLESNGKNLLLGLQNLLTDFESGPHSFVKMTDMNAFGIGENIANTPGEVIFRNDLIELIQYHPQTPTVHAIPLLIIPPWINKYYILDLSPENSLIRWLVSQSISVFVISWVNPDARYAEKGLYEYLQEGPIAAIKVIKKQLKVKQVNTLGFCIGGTLQALLLAYNKAHQDQSIKSSTFLASMIDFTEPGDISVFIDEEQIGKLEQRMSSKGYLEGHFMASAFNSLRASDLIWSFFIKNYLRGKSPVPFDILYWNADATNMPAKMHSQYLRWMYLHNDLIKPNKIHLNGTPLDVTQIDIPTFFVSTRKDHIAPWQTTYTGFQLMKGDKRFILGGSGHIAGIVIPPGSKKYGYWTNDYVGNLTAEEWLASATEHSGSWWPEWFNWLQANSGETIAAPSLKNAPLKTKGAPGTYVMMKAKLHKEEKERVEA